MTSSQTSGATALPIAILGAMPEEIAALLELLEGATSWHAGGFELHSGLLDGEPVYLAHSGVGKVNAAAVAQSLLAQGVMALVFTGVAGAVDPGLDVGDVVVATDALQHDVDVTALGYEPGRVPGEPLTWDCHPLLVECALEAASGLSDMRVVTGRVASGDQFIASAHRTRALGQKFAATCVEMEGAAVAQVCSRGEVPFVIIRSISDRADRGAQVSFREFTILAAQRAKRLVREMLPRVRAASEGLFT